MIPSALLQPTLWVVGALLCIVPLLLFFNVVARMRRMGQELDEQGIRIIQLGNRHLEHKREFATLKSSVATMADVLEHPNLQRSSISMSIHQPAAVESAAAASLSQGEVPSISVDDAPTNILHTREAANLTPVPESAEQAGEFKRKFADLQTFMAEFAERLSKTSIFIPATKETLLPVGTRVDLDFSTPDGHGLLRGKGEIRRVQYDGRSEGRSGKNQRWHGGGMEIRFIFLDQASKETLQQILSQSGQRGPT